MTKRWKIDPDHTVAAFAVKHLTVALVRGQFNRVRGVLTFDGESPEGGEAEAEIDVRGIYTGIGKRDDHLRSADFFDCDSFPTMRFRSREIRGTGGKGFRMSGDLTIRGVTREAVFRGELSGPVLAPFGGEVTIGFTAETSIDRRDFGIVWNQPLPGGGLMVANEVTIVLDGEADEAS